MSSKLLNYPSASSNPHLTTGSSAGSAAGSRNGGHGSAQLNFENLQLDDILCTVCQSVLVEPVFLPCQHRFCRNCLSGTIEKNNLNCPCCRKRFGTWYRNASRVNKLVHEQLWSAIQSQFRDYLEEDGARCNGNGSTGSCFVPQSESVIHLSEPGEIRKEYETELQRYRKELIEDKKKELAASEKYIINLYKQEGIIDLVDSDHLSISSSTSTPEPKKKQSQPAASDVHEVDDDEEAGPSGSSFTQPMSIKECHKSNPPQSSNVVSSSSSQVNASRPETSKSASNGSVISISSTSSASAASSSCISSASSRYSLIKSASQQVGHGAEIVKQKVHNSILNKISSSGGGAKKSFTIADLNKSELCVKPTKLHRKSPTQTGDDDDDDDDADDGDSLRSELNHFKPIIATTPKSCFSSKAIIRVPSIRPETGPLPSTTSVTECLSPSKSHFKPIDPMTPHRSAFSVVNVHLFTPPTIDQEESQQKNRTRAVVKKSAPPSGVSSSSSTSGSTAKSSKRQNKKKTSQPKAKAVPGAASRRKRKLKFSPPPKAKVKKSSPDRVPAEVAKSSRVTRRSVNNEAERLKDLIVTDQQRRAAMIEQERRDFEFAQKLQKKLNRTRGAMAVVFEPTTKELASSTSAPSMVSARSQNSAYSLRRKTYPTFQVNNHHQYIAEPSCNSEPAELEVAGKRKTDIANRKQLAQSAKKPKLATQEPVAAVEETNVVRRSTRNRH
ncbi:uncharacterized protein LOC131685598 [Topomyia yanbarensis]|uniref:uncharacterized protein LOC131685598 n=1 Tax=Topomyia yanbarensis TaxID=2498891 RepID=UPI00273CA63B|nr:uncharacterized protein LOC131685598 [Topomyia yanbarensis]